METMPMFDLPKAFSATFDLLVPSLQAANDDAQAIALIGPSAAAVRAPHEELSAVQSRIYPKLATIPDGESFDGSITSSSSKKARLLSLEEPALPEH
jgi:hypothetical protein